VRYFRGFCVLVVGGAYVFKDCHRIGVATVVAAHQVGSYLKVEGSASFLDGVKNCTDLNFSHFLVN
jgi:hypothetical protein